MVLVAANRGRIEVTTDKPVAVARLASGSAASPAPPSAACAIVKGLAITGPIGVRRVTGRVGDVIDRRPDDAGSLRPSIVPRPGALNPDAGTSHLTAGAAPRPADRFRGALSRALDSRQGTWDSEVWRTFC